MRRRLVLFDIDGTLVKPIGLGRRSLEAAFADRFGAGEVYAGVTFHGRTDYDIIEQGVQIAGGSSSDVDSILAAYLSNLEREVAAAPSLALPGVKDVLNVLSNRPDVLLGLVTGNVREGARIKLTKDDLRRYFPLGAFGCDSRDRGELVRLARRRAEAEAGWRADGDRSVFMIGDTQNDVLAARAGDAVAVAVATGGDSLENLQSYGPDHAFASFDPVHPLLEVLLA